jgi:hypothetical protein
VLSAFETRAAEAEQRSAAEAVVVRRCYLNAPSIGAVAAKTVNFAARTWQSAALGARRTTPPAAFSACGLRASRLLQANGATATKSSVANASARCARLCGRPFSGRPANGALADPRSFALLTAKNAFQPLRAKSQPKRTLSKSSNLFPATAAIGDRGEEEQRNQRTSASATSRLASRDERVKSSKMFSLLAADPSPAAGRPYRSMPRALFNCVAPNDG